MTFAESPAGNIGWLERRADEISHMLQCPVTIEDAEHRVLAYSMHSGSTDAIRIATIMSRRVPEHVIRSFHEGGVIRRLQKEEGPQRIEANEEIGLGSRVAIAVRSGKRVIGYIWAAETDQPLSESDMEKLRRAAGSIAGELQRQTESRWRSDLSQDMFLSRLVEGYFATEAEIRHQSGCLKRPLPEYYRIVAVDFNLDASAVWPLLNQAGGVIEEETGLYSLAHAAVGERVLFLAGDAKMLSSPGEWKASLEHLADRLARAFPDVQATVGAGGLTAREYSLAPRSYAEALKVIGIRRRFPRASVQELVYEELGYRHYLPAVAETIEAEAIVNSHVRLLREYDREHQADLTHTLSVLLDCDCGVREAAERLHIHPNTLGYRMVRMNEISGINLKSMSDKVAAFLYLQSGG